VVEIVHWAGLCGGLGHSEVLKEFPGVLITVIDSDVFGVNIDVLADHEIVGAEVGLALVGTEHFFSLKEASLRNA
jgi:hypothetical protein